MNSAFLSLKQQLNVNSYPSCWLIFCAIFVNISWQSLNTSTSYSGKYTVSVLSSNFICFSEFALLISHARCCNHLAYLKGNVDQERMCFGPSLPQCYKIVVLTWFCMAFYIISNKLVDFIEWSHSNKHKVKFCLAWKILETWTLIR